jgi:hypothetical protein
VTTTTPIYVEAVKRDGTLVIGTTKDDGLQSLWPVKQADGSIAYVSALDKIVTWEATKM